MHMTDTSKGPDGLRPGETIEETLSFHPKFGSDGLIPAIVSDAISGNVLMFAHMNDAALRQTVATGLAHFWSRSRGKLWKKGEESGNLLSVREVRTDCDQDVLWLIVDVLGDGVACHTGAPSCFYRRLLAASGPSLGMNLELAPLPRPSGRD
jgi:phosphoribosyl-AMP cyclohydrolase